MLWNCFISLLKPSQPATTGETLQFGRRPALGGRSITPAAQRLRFNQALLRSLHQQLAFTVLCKRQRDRRGRLPVLGVFWPRYTVIQVCTQNPQGWLGTPVTLSAPLGAEPEVLTFFHPDIHFVSSFVTHLKCKVSHQLALRLRSSTPPRGDSLLPHRSAAGALHQFQRSFTQWITPYQTAEKLFAD